MEQFGGHSSQSRGGGIQISLTTANGGALAKLLVDAAIPLAKFKQRIAAYVGLDVRRQRLFLNSSLLSEDLASLSNLGFYDGVELRVAMAPKSVDLTVEDPCISVLWCAFSDDNLEPRSTEAAETGSEPWILTVNLISGEAIRLKVHNKDMVSSVKARIQAVQGSSAGIQHIMLGSEEMQDFRTLGEYGINSKTMLTLVCRVTVLSYLYASPLDLPQQLNPLRDLRQIKQSLQDAMEVKASVATVSSFTEALMQTSGWLHVTMTVGFDNTSEGTCFFESPQATAHKVPLFELKRCIQAAGRSPAAFVFLGCCDGRPLAEVLRAASVRYVVFFDGEVRDSCAMECAKIFYRALARGQTVGHAYQHTITTGRLNNKLDISMFRLLYDSFDLNLPRQPIARITEEPQEDCIVGLPCHDESFRWGRRTALIVHGALKVLADHSIMVLYCEEPLGRTESLKAIARFVALPGRAFSGPHRCAFFPQQAPGGLLIVDDADKLSNVDKYAVQKHLDIDGAKVLASCRRDVGATLFGGKGFPKYYRLAPLDLNESVDHFLRNVRRHLTLADLYDTNEDSVLRFEIMGDSPHRRKLAEKMKLFLGNPKALRFAANNIRFETPSLRGDFSELSAGLSGFLLASLRGTFHQQPPGYVEGNGVIAHVRTNVTMLCPPLQVGPVSEDSLVLYHYTHEFAFRMIVGNKDCKFLMASRAQRAHFGEGVYTSSKAPNQFMSKDAILLNNYTNKEDPSDQEAQIATWRKKGVVDYCVPMVVDRSCAINVRRQKTKEMTEVGVTAHGNEPIRDGRDIWVVVLPDQNGEARNAEETMDAILHRCSNSNWSVRLDAVEMLCRRAVAGNQSAITAIMAALEDDEELVRLSAATSVYLLRLYAQCKSRALRHHNAIM